MHTPEPKIDKKSVHSRASKLELTEGALRANFDYWHNRLSAELERDPSNKALFLLNIPVTHTWGFEVARPTLDRYQAYVHEQILFEDGALLSASRRTRKGNSGDAGNPASRVGPNATAAGLMEYVFSYLGVHDPFYARGAYPAFGVFISREMEGDDPVECHASRRDFDSPEAYDGCSELNRNLLFAGDGRQIARLESVVDSRHQVDPWRYWGAHEFFHASCWEWKIEMRFRDRIEAGDFLAILWPIHRKVLAMKIGSSSATRLAADADRFQKTHPGCRVIKYFPRAREGVGRSLVRASTMAARSFVETGKFPRLISSVGRSLS